MRLMRLEKTPEGRVVNIFSRRSRNEKDEKERVGERNGIKEKPDCQDLQKHLKEGRRDYLNKGK